MERIMSKLRAFPKRFTVIAAVAVSTVTIPALLNAWGPERATYTIDNPADRVTFNSITDNPHIGDERNFVGIRENNTTGLWQDNQHVQAGKEYVVRMYVHNNAADNLNLVAEDVTATFNLPTTTGKSLQVDGYLEASNATPKEVYDHATFTSEQDFNLALVPGSIKYFNNAKGDGFPISESLFTSTGAKLGYDQLNGKIPGCFQYAGYLTFIVKPQFGEKPTDYSIKKEVRKAGETTWQDSVEAQPGDKLNYRLTFANTGQTELKNVTIKDTLPKNVSMVPGTARILNASNPKGAYINGGDSLVTTGINIGSYTGGGSNAIVIFDAMLPAADKLVCGPNTFRNVVSVTPEGKSPKEDDAATTVPKACEQPQPKTIEVCRLSDKTYPVTIKEDAFDDKKYSKNPADCKETPSPATIEVCELGTKKMITINESDFDRSKHSKDASDCAVAPAKPATPTAPEELPETGTTEAVMPFVGLGSLVTATGYYLVSRRIQQ